jgi:membrane associated rhomboid family serine protease
VVIPVYDKNPLRRTAYVTYALIVLNIVIFALGPTADKPGTPTPRQACAEQRFFVEHGAVPSELVSGRQLAPDREAGIRVSTAEGEVVCTFPALPPKNPFLSVLTAMFIHAGWLHLAGNMLFLFVFGNNVEDRLGRLHFLLFYLVSGYLATYAFAWLNPAAVSPLVGASGAIAGVLGAYLCLFPRAKVTSLVPFLLFLPLRFPAWVVLGSWFLLQLPAVQGLLGVPADDTVAYLAHVAGFLAGFCYLLLLTAGRRLSGGRPLAPMGTDLPLGPPATGPGGEPAGPDPYGTGNPFPYRYPQPPAD